MTATTDCKVNGQSSQSVNFEVGIGAIVRAREVAESNWTKSSVEGMAPWGLLLREIPEGPNDREGRLFAAIWPNIEIVPEYMGVGSDPEPGQGEAGEVAPVDSEPDPRDISINDGSPTVPEHGVAQGVPARIGARVFDGDGGVGIVVALTDQLVIYREDKDGLEYAQRYGFCSSTLRPAAETPGMTA